MKIKRSLLLNSVGIVVILFWAVMVGMLVKKVHFKSPLSSPEVTQGAVPVKTYSREWKEIFLRENKVGYAVSMIKPFEKGYFIQEEIFIKLNLMGLASGVYTTTQCRVDRQFILQSFNFRMNSGAVAFYASGRVEGEHLLVETGKGKKKRSQRLKLSRPPMIGAGIGPYFQSREIQVGQILRLPLFDPSTMSQKEAIVKVVSKEPIEINRRTFNAFRLEAEMWGKVLTFWLDEKGVTLKEEGFMGLTTIRSSAANAPRNIGIGGGTDFYEMTAVQVDRKLQKPTRARYLKVAVEFLEDASANQKAWNGERQKFQEGIMEITRETLPPASSYKIPFDINAPTMGEFLKPEFNIESDSQEIIQKAQEIAGNDRDPLSVSKKLLHWVYRNLDKKPVVAVPSALEVLKSRVGDCNEHATLLTAFLRALKIPGRICTGLVYTRGKFFYHAWTEAYVGRWISMDATLDQLPVDATHIKLLEGNLDKQVEIVNLIGKIKLKVLDYRYD